ncbi:MAG TPA: oligosaccharide flippase family protein [Vicinamibacterales bacterium]|nr:oligosaccharide flippase family protein [Vicinamibacterales bacterium]
MTDSNRIARAAYMLAGGRAPGLVIAFAIPLVLARTFDQAEFGTYKQLFLIYATLFGLAQAGMAESLYYFVPREESAAGRFVANAVLSLAAIGITAVVFLTMGRQQIADWLTNPALAQHLPSLGWFLALMLTSTVLEIVLLSRNRSGAAAWIYAGSDIARAACLIVPALIAWGLRGVMAGAVTFAAARVALTIAVIVNIFGSQLRADTAVLRRQLAYALPFAVAVGIEVLHINWHQYAVAARVDAAAFAIYAVGCLQVPVVDVIVLSACNVMMVEMAGAQHRDAASARGLWHDTIGRLAFMIFPLAAFLIVMAHPIIVLLFTSAYEASVPIFMLWSLTMVAAVLVVDGVLRSYAQTRYLLAQNLLHLAIVAGLAGTFIRWFGLQGAVLVTLLATVVVKSLAVIRISRLMHISLADALPWRRLAIAASCAAIAALPAIAISRGVEMPPLMTLPLAAAAYLLSYGALFYAVHRRGPIPAVSATI